MNDYIELLSLADKKIKKLEKEAVIAMKQHHDLCWNIAELEKEVEKEKRHYDALNNIRVDLLVRVKNLEAKALKEGKQ